MRLTKTSGLVALGLAGHTLADGWNDWASASSNVSPATTVSAPRIEAAATATETTTITTTTTVFEATTTVWHSTIFVGPGFCATTTVTVDGSGKPFPPIPTATSKSSTTAASSVVDPESAVTSTPEASYLVSPESTIGTDGAVFTWTGDVATSTSTVPAPTYTDWPSDGSWPEPGSPSSNVSAPNGPITGAANCNTAADRSKWCDGLSISDNYYTRDYATDHTCSYDLTITNTTLDVDGSGPKMAFAINGQVPGPLIECNWGDLLVITVHNKLTDNSTSIHWHGIWQRGTNDQDGVPGVTECGLAPGSSRTYTMRLNQYGTGWYHAHTMAQYGEGIRGPMVIHGPATANYDIDMGTVMVDDTFPGTAAQQNELISHIGPTGTVNYLLNGKNTKPDLSAGQHALWNVQSGKKHLFRLINSASQNMFSVHFDNHKMLVIATDYVPIVPYETEWLNIGIGQRYDVIVDMNQPTAGYFLRAVTQTGCPSGCNNTGLGAANGIFLYDGAQATLPTSTYGNKTGEDFAICADEPIASLVPFVKKSAGSASAFAATASTLPAGNVARVATSDSGTVFRWFLNNNAIGVNYTQPTLQTLHQYGIGGNFSTSSTNTNTNTSSVNGNSTAATNNSSSSSLISNSITLSSANQWVYFVIQNQFFASHPMHLHGHDFSLLGQGTTTWTPDKVSTLNFDNPPRRDTAMLVGSSGPGNPAGYTVIGFETDNPGAWLMHCHIVWHVDGGLALQWLERPDDIEDYAGKDDFKSECDSLRTWQQANPPGIPSSGQSGLRRRHSSSYEYLDETQFEARTNVNNVVRRLDPNLRRGLGDGFKHRHIRR
nr:hypothetical protein LTR18_005817 [Exophiala xenobiotica]